MNRKKSFIQLSKIRYKTSLSLIKMSEFQVSVSHRSTRSEKDVKSSWEWNQLLQILSCEVILALPEGLCIIELHSCGGSGNGKDAADGEVKAS